MSTNTFPITKAFQGVGYFALILGLSTVLFASLAYVPEHPDFSIFNTYLSDIGDTPGWSQIFFNSGTLLAAAPRYAVIVLLVLRLRHMGKKQVITDIAILSIGAISTFGTVMMTAVPFSIAPSIHKSGIGFYFFGVVFLQTLIGIKELRIKKLPRILPILSFIIVICFLIFFTLFLMLEAGYVDRSTPIFWEWMCYISSIVWLMGHTLVLGKDDNMHLSTT